MAPKNKLKAPTKTLTQRRTSDLPNGNSPSSMGTSRLSNLSDLGPSNAPSSFTPNGTAAKSPEEGGSPIKIVIWAIVILAAGIGLALVVRNLTKDNSTDTADTTQSEDTTQEEETDTTEAEETDTTTEETTDTTTEETTDTTDTTTTEDTTTTTTTTGLTNEYSQTAQTISDGLTTNSVTISGYKYETYSANFVYTIKLGQVTKYPGVTATLDSAAKTLTVVVSNVASDHIVGNGGSASTTFAGNGNTNTADISNSAGKTTFVFNLDKATNYKINAVDGTEYDSITVDIKNN